MGDRLATYLSMDIPDYLENLVNLHVLFDLQLLNDRLQVSLTLFELLELKHNFLVLAFHVLLAPILLCLLKHHFLCLGLKRINLTPEHVNLLMKLFIDGNKRQLLRAGLKLDLALAHLLSKFRELLLNDAMDLLRELFVVKLLADLLHNQLLCFFLREHHVLVSLDEISEGLLEFRHYFLIGRCGCLVLYSGFL